MKTKKGERQVTQHYIKRIKVRSGLRHGSLVDIPDGLKEGTLIVRRGFLGLRPRKVVTIVDDKNPPKRRPGNNRRRDRSGKREQKN